MEHGNDDDDDEKTKRLKENAKSIKRQIRKLDKVYKAIVSELNKKQEKRRKLETHWIDDYTGCLEVSTSFLCKYTGVEEK